MAVATGHRRVRPTASGTVPYSESPRRLTGGLWTLSRQRRCAQRARASGDRERPRGEPVLDHHPHAVHDGLGGHVSSRRSRHNPASEDVSRYQGRGGRVGRAVIAMALCTQTNVIRCPTPARRGVQKPVKGAVDRAPCWRGQPSPSWLAVRWGNQV